MLFGRLGLVWRRTQWVKAVAKGWFQMLFGRLVSGGKCWQIVFFYRDPERPFDTDRPRNWGSFGAELNGLKPWRRGGFRCFLGGWLVVKMLANCLFSIGIQSVRLTTNVRGFGEGVAFCVSN